MAYTDEQIKYITFLKSKNVPEDQAREMFSEKYGSGGSSMVGAPEAQASVADVADSGIGLKDVGMGALKAMDYLGGLTRTGVAGLGELVTGEDLYKTGDIGKALSGEAPTMSQILERGGVGEMGKLSDILPQIYTDTGAGFTLKKGGAADITGRGALGFVGDVALDPLTYASLGLSSIAKTAGKEALEQGAKKGLATKLGEAMVEKSGLGTSKEGLNLAGKVADVVLNPLEKLSKGSSEKVYAKAFQDADRVSRETGKKPLSKVLQEQGFVGDARDALDFTRDYNKQVGKGIENVLDEAASKGATVNMTDAFDRAMQYTSEIRKNPHPDVKKLADRMDEITLSLMEAGQDVPVNLANTWKSQINDLAKEGAFKIEGLGKSGIEERFDKIIGSTLSDNISKSVQKTDKSLSDKLINMNKEYAATNDTVQKVLNNQAEKELRRKTPISAVDLMMAGAGVVGHGTTGGMVALGGLAAKKLGQAAMSTKGRTMRGAATKKIAESGFASSAARQSAKNIKEKNK